MEHMNLNGFTNHFDCHRVLDALDVILNLKSCFEIVILQRRYGTDAESNIKSKVQDLVNKETLELLLPITYCIIFSVLYYGPNAEIYGNVKNSSWKYNKVENLAVPLTKIGIFLIVDGLRVLTSTLVLWKYCKILLFSEYCQMLETYGKVIAIYIAFYLTTVSNNLHFYHKNNKYK